MSSPTVRMVAFKLKGTIAATVNQVSVDIDFNRKAAMGQAGYYTHSRGAMMATFQIGEVTPIAGSAFMELLPDLLAQKDVDCEIEIGGKLVTVTCAVTKMGFKSASHDGMTDGTMTLEGGIDVLNGQGSIVPAAVI